MKPEALVKKWIEELQQEKGIGLRKLEEITGISRSKLSKLGHPGSRLSVMDAIELCKITGHSLSDFEDPSRQKPKEDAALERLMQLAEQRFNAPKIEDVSAWLSSCGGQIDHLHPFAQHIVLVDPAHSGDDAIHVNYIGPLSVTARALGSFRTEDAAAFVRDLPEHQRRPLVESYISVCETEKSHFSTRESMPTTSQETLQYFLLIRNCILPNGQKGLVNFASLASPGLGGSYALASG